MFVVPSVRMFSLLAEGIWYMSLQIRNLRFKKMVYSQLEMSYRRVLMGVITILCFITNMWLTCVLFLCLMFLV